ncbi:hypothetical protein BSL78_21605 [Apostichopus japonicus]|uniref:Uncharacterized protein n=1 Tax=Stichopus japonicus TaxID=307972 RepID=A0A2G8K0K7_STIJA|nr:hypothetical protein BSL78_21605 [Apostichopus japonicus]
MDNITQRKRKDPSSSANRAKVVVTSLSMERLTVQDKKDILISSLKSRYKLQYDAIQPIPYIKDRLYCVDKVFVEGGTEIHIVQGATRRRRTMGTCGLVQRYLHRPSNESQTAHHRSRSRVW